MPEESTTLDLAERVRNSYAASSRRDFDAMMSFYEPDAVWDVSPLGLGIYEGAAAIRSFFEDWVGTFEEFEMRPEEILELGGGVTFAVVLQSGRPAGSDGHVRWRFSAVTVWVDRMAVRTTNYTDIDEARAAAERLAASRGQAVSQANLAIVQEHFDALARRDYTAVIQLVDPDIVYRPTAMFTETRECRGFDQFRRFNDGWLEAWSDDFTSRATSFHDYGDAVIVRVQFSGHARASGVEVSGRAFHVCWLRNGRITRIEDFTERAEALKAVGLKG